MPLFLVILQCKNKTMNIFQQTKTFFRSHNLGDTISRYSLMHQEFHKSSSVTLDSYRLWFTHAGYLKWIKPGQYQYVKSIPEDISSRDLRKEAYPDTWKDWNDYRHLKK